MAPPRGSAADEKILSYGDVVLRRSDLSILSGPCFINDRLIDFFFTHLISTSPSTLLLLPPSLSFLLAHCPDPSLLPSITAPLRLPDRDVIVLTVNDSDDLSLPESGTHWSLLVYLRSPPRFLHLDSGGGMNRLDAEKLYRVLDGLVGGGGAGLGEMEVPRQRNGYDCGVHVMAAARGVCRWYEGGMEEGGMGEAVREEVAKVPEMRGDLLRMITEMMEQQRHGRDL